MGKLMSFIRSYESDVSIEYDDLEDLKENLGEIRL